MSQQILKDVFTFNGAMVPPVVASVTAGPWCSKDTSAAGAPTIAAAGGAMVLTLAADNEVENLCLYFGDVLPYDIDDLVQVDIWAKLTASLGSAVSAAWGMASARNDAIDSIAAAQLFRAIGSNAVYCESDDGTNDVDDIATGQTLVATYKRFTISYKEGLYTVAGGLSTGGKSQIIYSMEDSRGNLRRVCQNQRFNAENYSAGLQPFFQLQKTAATDVASLSIRRVEVQYRAAG